MGTSAVLAAKSFTQCETVGIKQDKMASSQLCVSHVVLMRDDINFIIGIELVA